MNPLSKIQLNWKIKKQLNQRELEQLISSEEGNIDDTLWEKRPIRLLNLQNNIPWKKLNNHVLLDKEYSRITSALKANYYKKETLKNFFSTDKALLQLLDEKQEVSNGVFFPTINENKNKYIPISSITSFCKIAEKKYDFKRDIKPNKNKLNKLLDFETKYFPEIIQYEEINGNSFEVAWFVKEWLYFYNSTFHEKKSIFCTGSIDDNGNIGKIEYPNEKLETALHFNFDYIIFPEENRNDLESKNKPNVIFFNNINQLKSWLLEMSENLSNLNKIPRWLSSSLNEPTTEDFINYFNSSITGNNINQWKQIIQSSSLKQKLEKLKIITNEYAKYICNIPKPQIYKHYPSFLPLDYFYFSLLDYFSCINDDQKAKIKDKESILKELEKLYYSLFYKLLSNDNNINIASLRLLALKQNQDQNKNDIYSFVLKKYPAIIGLFFNHPTDYLLLIASLKKENQLIYKNLINIIINQLEKHHKKNINLEKLGAKILKEIISNYSNEISYIKPAFKKTSVQMASLAKAKSLAIQNRINNLTKACDKYFEIIVNNLEQQIYSNYLLESFSLIKSSKLLDNWLKQNHQVIDKMKSDGFSSYIDELEENTNKSNKSKKEESYKDVINKSFKCSRELIKVLVSENDINKNKTTDFYPQPALYLFLFIKNNISNKTLKVLNDFSKSYKGNSFKLKTYCLSYWSGCLAAKLNNTLSLKKDDEYKLSFLFGYLRVRNDKKMYEYLKEEIDHLFYNINKINSLPFLQLIWIKFLDSEIIENSYFKEIITNINNFLRNIEKDNTIATFIKKLICTSEEETIILNNPQRSLQQLLFQLVKLLIDNEYDDFNLDECGLNNSQFITEFIRVFCLNNNSPESLLFIPIHWRTSIDKQIFNTIAISYFYINKNKNLLQNYLFSIIDDLPNLLLGFKLLDEI